MNNMYENNFQPFYAAPYDYNNYGYAGGYQPVVMQQPLVPQNINALTDDEIRILESTRPQTLNINIDPNDVLRSMCTHKKNGRDVVQRVNDGTDDVWCPICNARWNPNMIDNDELKELVDKLTDQMENAKWVGDLPVDLSRDLFTIEPLVKLYPKIHKYAMNNFNKYYSQNAMINAADTSVYSQYNSLFGPSYGYNVPAYPQQQAYMPAPNMAPQQGNGLYFNQANSQPYQQPMGGNPYVNPMQAPYGMNPMAPNQQFVQQAVNMMPNGYNGMQQPTPAPQPAAQPQPQPTATFATPQPQAYQPQPVANTNADESKTVNI